MDKEDFLNKISMIESSGGKDLNHKEMTSGIHEGDAALGKYGLMPNTIQEIIRRQRQRGPLEESLTDIYKQDPNFIKEYFNNNPSSEDEVAGKLVDKIGLENPDKSAYMWNQGHNLDPNSITDEDLNNSNYVQKFRSLVNKFATK